MDCKKLIMYGLIILVGLPSKSVTATNFLFTCDLLNKGPDQVPSQ